LRHDKIFTVLTCAEHELLDDKQACLKPHATASSLTLLWQHEAFRNFDADTIQLMSRHTFTLIS